MISDIFCCCCIIQVHIVTKIAPSQEKAIQRENSNANATHSSCTSCVLLFSYPEGVVAHLCNPLTLQSEQSGRVGSKPGIPPSS